MDCHKASISMQLAEDGEIAKEELKALDSHLSSCLVCRRVSAWLNALEENYPAPNTLDDDFADAVMKQLKGERSDEIRHAHPEIETATAIAKSKPERKHPWLGRIWSLVTRPRQRKVKLEKRPAWFSRVAHSMWSLITRRRRKPVAPEKRPEPSNAADLRLLTGLRIYMRYGSFTFGLKSVGPALAPAVAGPSYATGWLRIAGSGLRGKARVRG